MSLAHIISTRTRKNFLYVAVAVIILLMFNSVLSIKSANAATLNETRLHEIVGTSVSTYGTLFGQEVALSEDGNTAIVGAPRENVGPNTSQGAAYIFTRSNGIWSLQQRLVASDPVIYGNFGFLVSISGDTAIICTAGSNQAIYVFTRSGSLWTQQAKITVAGGYFDSDIAIDGDTIVAADVSYNTSFKGKVYVFCRTGTTWSQQGVVTASDGQSSDKFGYALAIEGDNLVVGAPGNATNRGAAYIFTRTGSAWTQQTKLTANDGALDDHFGESVAISNNTVIAGTSWDNESTGAVYVYEGYGAIWNQKQKLLASDHDTYAYFGRSADIAGDTIVVGSFFKSLGVTNPQGKVYIFKRSEDVWSEQSTITASDLGTVYNVSDEFGWTIATDGDTVLVGTNPREVKFGEDTYGKAYIYDQSLTNAAAPVITAQPSDITVNAGEAANLSIAATGTGNISYEWFKGTSTSDGISLGITTSSYTAPTNTAGTTYYYCIVTNTDNNATGNKTASTVSNVAAVTVKALTNADAPVIVIQPSDMTVNIGEAANLSVTATGTGDLSYEWFTGASASDGISLGITTSSYTAPTNTAGTTYYYCIVTNTDNNATGNKTASTISDIVKVTVADTAVTPVDQIIDYVCAAIDNGTLTGNGSPGKLNAFYEKLADVKLKIEAGEIKAAINELYSIYAFVDGKPSPKDLVVGESADEIREMILNLIEELENQL